MAISDTTHPPPRSEEDETIYSNSPPLSDSSPPPPSKEPPPPSPPTDNPPPPPDKKTPPSSSPPDYYTETPPPSTPSPPTNSKDKYNPPPVEPPPPPPPSPSSKDDQLTSPSPPPPTTPSTKTPSSPTPSQDKNNNTPPPTNSNAPPTNSNPPPVDSKSSPTTPPGSNAKSPLVADDSQMTPPPPFVPTPTTNDSPVKLPPIYDSTSHSKSSPPPPITSQQSRNSSSSESSNNETAIIVGASVGGILIIALVMVCFVCRKRQKKQSYYYDNERQSKDPFYNGTTEWNNNSESIDHVVGIPPHGMMGTSTNYSSEHNSGNSGQHPQTPMGGLGSSQCQFSYEDLAAATSGFSQANLLGQGGFGYVHKGVLPDGRVVAVKSLKSGSGQGEREFQAEVEIISRVHHRHLVSLVGYCITNGERMLVYEFVPNQTMEHHLHGKGQPVMDWSFRVRIAIGSAKGLAYLHEDCHPRIIHRDIKAANILLDENYEAMVADFGLAKLTTENFTHVSTRVMGTFGYMAPEYASSGKLSEKSDVFSFGVMLLELITGRRPIDLTGETMEDSLADWARPLLEQAMENGNVDELVDPRLEGNFGPQEMNSMISCAAASIRHSAKRRPKMSQIVRALEGDSILVEETNPAPKKKANIGTGSTTTHDSSYDTVAYNADMMKFRNMVMSSQEFGTSSEYGATSEYGLNPSSTSSSNNSKEMGSANSGQHKLKY